MDSCLVIQSNLLSELQDVVDKRSCFLGNDYVKALGTSPPQELICFRWRKVITYESERERSF